MSSADDTFRAVAHPLRRAILDTLARGERTAGELVALFDVSQPAVSQHLAVLKEAGLVRSRREGKQQVYGLYAGGLREVHDWASHYERFWEEEPCAPLVPLGRKAGKARRS